MKHILFTGLLLFALGLQAQVPQWRIHPKYSSVEIIGNGLYVVSENGKYGILNAQEQVILPIEYQGIGQFEAHYAPLFNNDRFVAYVSDEGRLVNVADKHYEIIGEPLFFDGYLLVRNANGYFYVRAQDDKTFGPFTGGFPFSEGYASVRVPKNLKHIIDGDFISQFLSAQSGNLEKLNLGGYDTDDVDFISSVSNGKSVIVLKKRFHELDMKNGTLTPFSTDGDVNNKKSRVFANERPVNFNPVENGFNILFKQGNMTFDPRMRLTGIIYNGQNPQTIAVPERPTVVKQTNIKITEQPGGGLNGLVYGDKEILTPQFEKVELTWNNEAIVKMNGKYGVVAIDPNHTCRFVLNDNLPVGFEHKSVKTNIKAVCPPNMKPMLMKLTSLDDTNCHINTDTRKENVNVETAVLSYECSLNIPDEIGLDKQPTYASFALNYDGLKFSPNKISFDTWYINNYGVQILKHQLEGSVLSAEILVSNRSSNGRNYFKNVTVEAEDSVITSLTKVSEDMYDVKFYGFKKSNVRFSVDVAEDGCPTLTYDLSLPTGVNTAKEAKEPEQEKTTSQGQIKKTRKTPVKKEPEKKKVFIAY